MDATNKFDSKKFYERKAENLTKLRDALQFAINDLWALRLEEKGAPCGDTEEMEPTFTKIGEAHQEVCALLDAVQAMLP